MANVCEGSEKLIIFYNAENERYFNSPNIDCVWPTYFNCYKLCDQLGITRDPAGQSIQILIVSFCLPCLP